MNFRPLHDRVLVRRVEAEEKTAGGIIIPDSAKEKPQEGEVVAAGAGAKAEDGSVTVISGNPDIGGSRASMAIMAAETLGVDYGQVRAIVADTASVGYTHVTGGSRVTFATGTAVVNATKSAIKTLCERAALIWGVDPDGVVWEDGHAKPAGDNAGKFPPLSLKDIAGKAAATGGPISTSGTLNAGGQAPGFGTQFCDVEVDPETGKVTILRFVAAQDVGRAIHDGKHLGIAPVALDPGLGLRGLVGDAELHHRDPGGRVAQWLGFGDAGGEDETVVHSPATTISCVRVRRGQRARHARRKRRTQLAGPCGLLRARRSSSWKTARCRPSSFEPSGGAARRR